MPFALDALLVAQWLLLGTVVGFLAGLLGVGGGMMMVPVLTLLLSRQGVDGGTAVKMAIATSMATIVFTSLSSLRTHQRLGTVRWPIFRALAPGILAGSLIGGAGMFAALRGRWLALLFAAFLAYMAVQMLRDRRPPAARVMPGAAGTTAVGAVIGFVSSLVGAGGAFLSVPFMTACNVPPRQAVGTSAALGLPIALASTAGYLVAGRDLPPALPGAVGHLYLPALAVVSLASVCLAPLGARTAQRLDVAWLRRLFAVLLLGLSASMLWRGLTTA